MPPGDLYEWILCREQGAARFAKTMCDALEHLSVGPSGYDDDGISRPTQFRDAGERSSMGGHSIGGSALYVSHGSRLLLGE